MERWRWNDGGSIRAVHGDHERDRRRGGSCGTRCRPRLAAAIVERNNTRRALEQVRRNKALNKRGIRARNNCSEHTRIVQSRSTGLLYRNGEFSLE
jgi:hypothetical protein